MWCAPSRATPDRPARLQQQQLLALQPPRPCILPRLLPPHQISNRRSLPPTSAHTCIWPCCFRPVFSAACMGGMLSGSANEKKSCFDRFSRRPRAPLTQQGRDTLADCIGGEEALARIRRRCSLQSGGGPTRWIWDPLSRRPSACLRLQPRLRRRRTARRRRSRRARLMRS